VLPLDLARLALHFLQNLLVKFLHFVHGAHTLFHLAARTLALARIALPRLTSRAALLIALGVATLFARIPNQSAQSVLN